MTIHIKLLINMFFNKLNIDEVPIIKELCTNILEDFLKNIKNFDINTEYSLLYNHICKYIEDLKQSDKNIAFNSLKVIHYNEYYKQILEKIELYYDYDPLIVICNDIINNHYNKLQIKILINIT